MPNLRVELPEPHERQWEIERSPARRKVICAGRRGGKTTLAARVAIKKAGCDKRRILYATPTQDQHGAFWDKCKAWLAPLLDRKLVRKNETMHTLDFPNGGHIRAKTAWNADTLRGDYADLLILDEYALMDRDAWDMVGAPMLLDNDGDAWFISTPRRKNHFFHAHVRGIADGKRWAAFHFTSHDNPHLSKAALAEITHDLSEEAYQQEILALFLDNEGAVFRKIAACLVGNGQRPEDHEGHEIVMGVDWGKQNDFTALSVFCVNCKREVELDRFNKINYSFQRKRLSALSGRWNVFTILAESNAMGDPIIEELQLRGLPVEGFATTATSKPPLIENLSLAFERTEAYWLNDPVGKAELEAYERTVSDRTGRSSYSAPEGLHDDTVMARALALWASRDAGPYAIMI